MEINDRSSTVNNLVLDLLEWLGTSARPYDEVLDAWRTSCPGLPVWETANERRLIERHRLPDSRPGVAVSARGLTYLREARAGARR
jgi:D-3-phosphoglycerate dehydrogenase